MEFIAILCLNYNNAIGYKETNDLVFDIKEEMNNFKKITLETKNDKKNVLIMGRNTWESIRYKPLKDRMNFIISSNYENINYDYREKHNVIAFPNNETCLTFIYDNKDIYDKIFIIGGISIYEYYLNNDIITKIICTKITTENNCGNIFFNINYFNFFKIDKLIECSDINSYNKVNNTYTKLNYLTITYNKFSKIDINLIYNINNLTKNFNEDVDSETTDNSDTENNIKINDDLFYISSDENESTNDIIDNNEHDLINVDSWTFINNDIDDIIENSREKKDNNISIQIEDESESETDKTYYF